MVKEACDLRAGNVIKVGNDLMVIQKATYHNPGRSASVMRLKMKNLMSGQVVETAYRSENKCELVVLDRKPMQYMYKSGDACAFMDQENYEQFELQPDILGDAINLIKEQMVIEVMLYNGNPVSVELPIIVELKIEYTEPAVRGDTSGKVMKTAKLETGFEVMVPSYCNIGETIRIDTRTSEYMERVK